MSGRPKRHGGSNHRPLFSAAMRRLVAIVVKLASGGRVSVYTIMEDHGVSLATAKRDVTLLLTILPLTYEPEDPGLNRRYLRMVPGAQALALFNTRGNPVLEERA